MCLRYSFFIGEIADRIDGAIAKVLDDGLRTADIAQAGGRTVGTREMGDAIIAKLDA
jgi:3-isopropylmalate dehydrogenase